MRRSERRGICPPGKNPEIEVELEETATAIRDSLMRLPNILHESVPIGKDDTENMELRRVGEPIAPLPSRS